MGHHQAISITQNGIKKMSSVPRRKLTYPKRTEEKHFEQDACTGVHSACRREEMCTTPSTAQAGANAGISCCYGGEGGLDFQIWDLNRAHETETTVFQSTGFQHV